ncbi:MAG: helix-turn-helix transcriptional regulator [Henriciella sp.]|jgi:transcriptional regulator with XRE-family HTH domain
MPITPDATKIKRWREERHWSQEHLCEIAGIGLRTLQRIEKGEAASRESAMALAAAFNVDICALIEDPVKQKALAAQEKAIKGRAALQLSFWIHFASFVFGMIVFAAISLGDGAPGYAMLAPSLWWAVGIAGHGLAVVIVELATRFEKSAA